MRNNLIILLIENLALPNTICNGKPFLIYDFASNPVHFSDIGGTFLCISVMYHRDKLGSLPYSWSKRNKDLGGKDDEHVFICTCSHWWRYCWFFFIAKKKETDANNAKSSCSVEIKYPLNLLLSLRSPKKNSQDLFCFGSAVPILWGEI